MQFEKLEQAAGIQMTRSPKTDDQLWNIVAESSFEVVRESLMHIADKRKLSISAVLSESQAATCALQELNNRAMGLKPETLRE